MKIFQEKVIKAIFARNVAANLEKRSEKLHKQKIKYLAKDNKDLLLKLEKSGLIAAHHI